MHCILLTSSTLLTLRTLTTHRLVAFLNIAFSTMMLLVALPGLLNVRKSSLLDRSDLVPHLPPDASYYTIAELKDLAWMLTPAVLLLPFHAHLHNFSNRPFLVAELFVLLFGQLGVFAHYMLKIQKRPGIPRVQCLLFLIVGAEFIFVVEMIQRAVAWIALHK